MLTHYGYPFLLWFSVKMEEFSEYLARWREILDPGEDDYAWMEDLEYEPSDIGA